MNKEDRRNNMTCPKCGSNDVRKNTRMHRKTRNYTVEESHTICHNCGRIKEWREDSYYTFKDWNAVPVNKFKKVIHAKVKEDKRKIVIPFTLEQFEDAIERIKAEYHAGDLDLVGLFEIETLEYYYERAKEYERESEKETAKTVLKNTNYDNCPVCYMPLVDYDKDDVSAVYCKYCGQRLGN